MKYCSIIFLPLFLFLTGCSTLKPESFADNTTVLDPVKFFGGHTHSSGVLEAHSGKPSVRISTKTAGTFANGILHIEQDLYPERGKQNHRNFNLKLIDANHVEGTGSDISGTTHRKLYGNYFTWNFRLKIAEKGLVQYVNMTQ